MLAHHSSSHGAIFKSYVDYQLDVAQPNIK
jgi:hypothetical protein